MKSIKENNCSGTYHLKVNPIVKKISNIYKELKTLQLHNNRLHV